MSVNIETADTLFEGGPFPHFQKSLGLFRPIGRHVEARAGLIAVVGWLPLLLLLMPTLFNGDSTLLKSFFYDIAIHSRLLLAAPLLVLCETFTVPRLRKVADYFVSGHLIHEEDVPKFNAALHFAKRVTSSTAAELFAAALAYGAVVLFVRNWSTLQLPAWYFVNGSSYPFSLAGWWYLLVSMPLFLILFFTWLCRLVIWSGFLFHVSRLKLHYIAAHPDKLAGLKFLNISLYAFMPLAFTLGVIVAGPLANRVLRFQIDALMLKRTVGGLVVFVLILFVSPLFVFTRKLHLMKLRGIASYGKLAHGVGTQFEEKWLDNYEEHGKGALEASDFSATTDLYQIVANVHEMSIIPFEFRSLIALVVTAVLPFVPVVIMALPIKTIMREVMKLLF